MATASFAGGLYYFWLLQLDFGKGSALCSAVVPGGPLDRLRKAINSISPALAEDFTDEQLLILAAAGFKAPNEFLNVERKELMALGLTLAQAGNLQEGEPQRPGACGLHWFSALQLSCWIVLSQGELLEHTVAWHSMARS